jgi:hypothetical protein
LWRPHGIGEDEIGFSKHGDASSAYRSRFPGKAANALGAPHNHNFIVGAAASKFADHRPNWDWENRLGCALAQKACRDGFTILHKRAAEMFRDLAVAHVDGSFGRLLTKLSRIDILVLDDFAMAPLKDSERRDFLELCDDRYQRRSMILTSQLPLAHWHEQIGDPTLADSILDRLVHNAYRIELNGDSLRKKRGRNQEEAS